MSNLIRKEVLQAFKRLHRTRKYVFKGDQNALSAARAEINSNFRKNSEITDAYEIKKLIQLASDVDQELRSNVLQAIEKESGLYEVKIRKEIPRLDNVIYNPDAIIAKPRRDAAKCPGAPPVEKT